MVRKYNLENICNLDDVEKFLSESLPNNWKVLRGKNTYVSFEDHAKDYEVIQVYLPTDKVYAEFWKGYYKEFPKRFNSFYGPKSGYFSRRGGLTFAIDAIMKKVEEMTECS